MRDKVLLHVPGAEEPLTLYAPSLVTSPWSAEVVRLLGGSTGRSIWVVRESGRRIKHAGAKRPRGS